MKLDSLPSELINRVMGLLPNNRERLQCGLVSRTMRDAVRGYPWSAKEYPALEPHKPMPNPALPTDWRRLIESHHDMFDSIRTTPAGMRGLIARGKYQTAIASVLKNSPQVHSMYEPLAEALRLARRTADAQKWLAVGQRREALLQAMVTGDATTCIQQIRLGATLDKDLAKCAVHIAGDASFWPRVCQALAEQGQWPSLENLAGDAKGLSIKREALEALPKASGALLSKMFFSPQAQVALAAVNYAKSRRMHVWFGQALGEFILRPDYFTRCLKLFRTVQFTPQALTCAERVAGKPHLSAAIDPLEMEDHIIAQVMQLLMVVHEQAERGCPIETMTYDFLAGQGCAPPPPHLLVSAVKKGFRVRLPELLKAVATQAPPQPLSDHWAQTAMVWRVGFLRKADALQMPSLYQLGQMRTYANAPNRALLDWFERTVMVDD